MTNKKFMNHDILQSAGIDLSRRTLLRWSAAAASGAFPLLASDPRSIYAQEKAATNLAPLNRFSRMVQELFVDQIKAAESKIKERIAGLKTKQDAENYVQS